jgi:N-acyl-D-aspartate/D-glutamate deacylase
VSELDLVIRGGTVVDGTGAPRRRADIGVAGGRIVAVGDVSDRAVEEIDADGRIVSPGWVDVHTHYDGQVSWDTEMLPSSIHGVTTAVMGNCGVGFAPVRRDRHEWLVALMEGVEDIPGTALHEGITWEWESFPEYLEAIERTPRTIDIGAQVPHAALRGYVMGDRGGDHNEVPTPAEIEEMGRLVAEGVEAGGLGFTTSRTVAHRSADGSPTPSLTATRDELVGIARAMGATGKGVFEVVADFVDLADEFSILRAMVEVSRRPMSITILQRPGFPPDEYSRILALISDANLAGLPIRGQVAPRPVGVMVSLDGRANPLRPSATYQRLESLPGEQRLMELQKPEVRERVLAELADQPPSFFMSQSCLFELGDPPRYDQAADESIAARAASLGVPVMDLVYDVLVGRSGRGVVYVPVMNYVEGNYEAVRDMLVHPLTVPGLGDAGAHCSMICDGGFATYLLEYWGREAPEAQRLPVEWIVKRQCADTAALVGLNDRGVLAPGKRADINVIDLEGLSVEPPEMLFDLPAGGKRLVQRPRGYAVTVVAGQIIARDDQLTGALPGRLVRGAR